MLLQGHSLLGRQDLGRAAGGFALCRRGLLQPLMPERVRKVWAMKRTVRPPKQRHLSMASNLAL